jgi:hypothetical protein
LQAGSHRFEPGILHPIGARFRGFRERAPCAWIRTGLAQVPQTSQPSLRALVLLLVGPRSLSWALTCAIGCATSSAPAQPTVSSPTSSPTTEPARPSSEPAPAPTEASPLEPTPPPIVIEGYSAEVAAVLAESHVVWRGGRTRIALSRRGAVRLRPDGPDLGLRDGASFPAPKRLQVLEDAERPRVVTDERDIRLLLHVDREDARPILVRAVPLRPTPGTTLGDPPHRGHVILKSRAWVDVTAHDGTMVRVTHGDSNRVRSGWIEADALGTTATVVARTDDWTAYMTKRNTKLLARPGGKLLTKLDVDVTVLAISSKAVDGHRLVEYHPPCEDDLAYVGFVRERDLHQPNYGVGHGCGFGSPGIPRLFGDADPAPRVVLDAGRFLLDADQPLVVGCVLAPTEVAELGEAAMRWRRSGARSPFASPRRASKVAAAIRVRDEPTEAPRWARARGPR